MIPIICTMQWWILNNNSDQCSNEPDMPPIVRKCITLWCHHVGGLYFVLSLSLTLYHRLYKIIIFCIICAYTHGLHIKFEFSCTPAPGLWPVANPEGRAKGAFAPLPQSQSYWFLTLFCKSWVFSTDMDLVSWCYWYWVKNEKCRKLQFKNYHTSQ